MLVQHQHVVGIMTAFKSKVDEWIEEIKINDEVFK